MFKRLLVPLDRSALAEQALGRAAALARATDAVVDLVLVHQPFAVGGFDDVPWRSETWHAEDGYLDAIAAELASGASVQTTHTVLSGDPIDQICGHADATGTDLIVMTSHGRTGLSRAWLGSVADGVLRRSGAPVLLLRPTDGTARGDAPRTLFQHILVPIDESLISASILPVARALAKAGGGRVTLLRVVRPVPTVVQDLGMPVTAPLMVIDEPATERVVERAREEVAAIGQRASGSEAPPAVEIEVSSHAAQAILDHAAAHGIDAIALTTRGRGAARLVMGSVADKVLRASDLPLLVRRPALESEGGASDAGPRGE